MNTELWQTTYIFTCIYWCLGFLYSVFPAFSCLALSASPRATLSSASTNGLLLLRCSKAPSTPATISKQHCRMLQVERFFRQCRVLLRHCCRFWQQLCRFRQQCRSKCRPFDKVEKIEHVQFVSILSKEQNFTKNLFDIVVKNGNNVEATFDFVDRNNFTINSLDTVAVFGNKAECCFEKVERCFDIVAGVDRTNSVIQCNAAVSLTLMIRVRRVVTWLLFTDKIVLFFRVVRS